MKLNNRARKLTLQVVFLVQVLLCQGCNIFGFLASPGPFEEKVATECELKSKAAQKILVWVEALPGSGADSETADRLHSVIRGRLTSKAGISKKYILTQNPPVTSVHVLPQTPEDAGREAGAGFVLYVRIEEYSIDNLHSDTIYTGQMAVRAFLIQSEDGEVICPKEEGGIAADLTVDMSTKGRKYVVDILNDSAAHCIVRRFYRCPKYEYQVNEERSTMNEMIKQDVY